MKKPCPTCEELTEQKGNRWRPFCSSRCRLMDLGSWLRGDYVIPEKVNKSDFEVLEREEEEKEEK